MPNQEVFFDQVVSGKRVVVLKSYDQAYAREAFDNMDEESLKRLWTALKPEEQYEAEELPKLGNPEDVNGEAEAFLWDELLEQAREDGNVLSLNHRQFTLIHEVVH